MTTLALYRHRLMTKAATALLAAVVAGGLISAVPFYPVEWRWLIFLATGALWLLKPGAGMAVALVSLVPAIAHQQPAALPLFILLAAVVASCGPYAFLVGGTGLAAMAVGLPPAVALAVPLAMSFGTMARAIVTAFAICIAAELILLLADQDFAAALPLATSLAAGGMKPALVSLTDQSWFSDLPQAARAAAPGTVDVIKDFVRQPMLLAQAGIWAAAAATGCVLRERLSARAAFSPLASAAAAAAVLYAGYLLLPPLLGHQPVPQADIMLSVFLPAGFVALTGGGLRRMASALGDGLVISRSGAKGGGRSGAAREIPRDTWGELAGIDDLRREISEAVDSQFHAGTQSALRSSGLRPTKGILLFGPPGTGKTKLARIAANQAGAAFYAVSGSDFASKWFGESEANLRTIFEEAMKHRPSVLFFDELEAFLPKRSQLSRADAPEKRIVATFLAHTDGIDALENVLLIGATNHPDMIDPAALRPGRFDKLIYVAPPGPEARRAILERYLAEHKTSSDVDVNKLAARMERFTGADIEAVCSSALKQAVRRTGKTKATIAMQDLDAAMAGIRPSVGLKMLREYENLSQQFGRRDAPAEVEKVAETKKHSWDDVAGLGETKDALREAVELPLANPELLQDYGVRPAKGVLLFGPPGCGKTFLAKVVADEARANFLHVKGPELLRGLIGQSEEQLRDLFIRARESSPCVLFFDEIDALAGARGTKEASATHVLTQLLTEMDGMEELKGVIVIAATNRPDTLDGALLRPGRFDRLLYVPPPDAAARLALLQKDLNGKPLAEEIALQDFADASEGFSAAEITSFCNAAAMAAAKETLRTGVRHGITTEMLRYYMEQTPHSLTAEIIAFYDGLRAQMQR